MTKSVEMTSTRECGSRSSNSPTYHENFERQYQQKAAELEEASTQLSDMPDMLEKIKKCMRSLRAEDFRSPRAAHNNNINETLKQQEHVRDQLRSTENTDLDMERHSASLLELVAKEISLTKDFNKNRAQKQKLAYKLLGENQEYIKDALQFREAMQAMLSRWSPEEKVHYPTPIPSASSPGLHEESMDNFVAYGANAPRSSPSLPMEATREIIRVSSDPYKTVGTEDGNTTNALPCSATEPLQIASTKGIKKRMSEPGTTTANRAPRPPTLKDFNDEGEIDFNKLYFDGRVLLTSFVNLTNGAYYILYCWEHDKPFRCANPWPSATSHFRSQHGDYSKEACIRLFGVPVINCNSESLMREYNAAIKECLAIEKTYGNDAERTTQSTPCQNASTINRSFSLQNEAQRDEEHASIIRPKVGCLFLSTRQSSDYALVVLPFGSFEPLGLPGSIVDTGLMNDERRPCHDQDLSTGRYIWSKGYEDGGPKESQREVPVLWIDHDEFPEHARYGWRCVCDLRKFSTSERFQFQSRVFEYISQRMDNNPTFETDDTEYYTESQPSVPAVRDPARRYLEIDAYFEDPIEVYSNSAEEKDNDDSGDYVDDDSKRRRALVQPPAKRLRTSSYNDRASVAEMDTEPHTITPNTDKKTPSQRVVDVDTNAMNEMINYEGPPASPPSGPEWWSCQRNDCQPSTNTFVPYGPDEETPGNSTSEPVWGTGSQSPHATESFAEQRMKVDSMRNDSTKVPRHSEAGS